MTRSTINFAQPDITLVLDREGTIRETKLSNSISDETTRQWIGRPWTDTVADAGGETVRSMLEDALTTGVSGFHQITQCFPSGLELPIEYTAVRLSERAGLIAIGKSLQAVSELQSRLIAAHRTMEQDYWKLREIETHYRLLFDASNEGVLTLQSDDLRIIEANPAAIRSLGLARGRDFLDEMAPNERDPFKSMIGRVREHGKAPGIIVHFGPERVPWMVRASLMNSGENSVFLVQLTHAGLGAISRGPDELADLDRLVEDLPDGLVVIDRDLVVRWANRAFLDLVQVGAEGGVLGQRLDRWMNRPGADLRVLLANLRRNGSVRLFATTIQGQLGTVAEVEISASGDLENAPHHVCILARDVGRRLSTDRPKRAEVLNGSAALQAGTTSLRDLVRDAVRVVERHYIEAALDMVEGNRTAAAELLGLSRQSLYTKLSRHGIEASASAPQEDAD